MGELRLCSHLSQAGVSRTEASDRVGGSAPCACLSPFLSLLASFPRTGSKKPEV